MNTISQLARRWSVMVALAAFITACGGTAATPPPPADESPATPAPAATGGKLPVVVTFSVLGDMLANVGGDLVEVSTLVGPGGDAHTFEPTPADSARLAAARIVIENGLEFEPWLDDLYTASGSQATRIAASEGVEPITAGEAGDEHAGEEHAAEDGHGEFDPHIWHDVQNAIRMVENIRDGLAAADPANAAGYQANASTYIAQLKELDAFVQQQVAQIPADRRKLVTSHDTFGYFAKRYGFEIVGTALGALSTEVADPPASEIAALIQDIKAAAVPAIFAENVANPALMETIAREAGVTLAPTLYTDALGEAGSPGATYIGMVRANVETIAGALKG